MPRWIFNQPMAAVKSLVAKVASTLVQLILQNMEPEHLRSSIDKDSVF